MLDLDHALALIALGHCVIHTLSNGSESESFSCHYQDWHYAMA